MTTLPPEVHITEEGPREGFQIEPGTISTAAKVELIDALSRTGLRHIQVVSFVNPKRVPGMADAEEVVRRIRPEPGVAYSALWLNERGLQRALALDRLTLEGKIAMYPSEAFLLRNQNRTLAAQREEVQRLLREYHRYGVPVRKGSVSSAFGCNFEGDIAPARVVALIDDMLGIASEHGIAIETVTLADTMAWATPLAVKRLIGTIRDRHPALRLSLHLHDTRGMGIANACAGLEMGVTHFDASVAGLGGCPFAGHRGAAGNVCTEDLVFMCEEMGVRTGIDLEALIRAARLAEEIVGHPLPGAVMKGGSLRALRAART